MTLTMFVHAHLKYYGRRSVRFKTVLAAFCHLPSPPPPPYKLGLMLRGPTSTEYMIDN